jgi:hypothetical protein
LFDSPRVPANENVFLASLNPGLTTPVSCIPPAPVSTGQLTKTGPAQPFRNNRTGTYQIQYRVDNPTGAVSIQDSLPTPLEYVVGSVSLPTGGTVRTAGVREVYFENLPSTNGVTFTITFQALFDPGLPPNLGQCSSSLTNSNVRMFNSASVNVGPVIASLGSPPSGSAPTTDVQCFWVDKQVRGPTGGFRDTLTGIEQGETITVRIDYRVGGSGVLPSWAVRDFPAVGKYVDPTYASLNAVRDGVSVIAESDIEFVAGGILFKNQPTGAHRIVFSLTVSPTACPGSNADDQASVVEVGTLDLLSNSIDTAAIQLVCPFQIVGDVGAEGGVSGTNLLITGPSVIAATGTVATTPLIRPQVRKLENYVIPSVWLNQFDRARERLRREFARTTDVSTLNQDLLSGNPLGVWQINISRGSNTRLGSVIFTNSRPATIIFTGNPSSSFRIDGNIDNAAPLALVFTTDRDIEITGGNGDHRTFNKLAIIAPRAKIKLGRANRTISWRGLVIARTFEDLDSPSGSITFDKLLVEAPPPGLAQLFSPFFGEQAP